MALPTITLAGNITAQPEMKFTKNGKEFITFRVACNDRRKTETGEWVDGDTTYVSVTSWRNAHAIAQLGKGARVIVQGSLRQRDYESQTGEKRTAYDVNAETVAQVLTDKNPQAAPAAGNWGAPAATGWDEETPF